MGDYNDIFDTSWNRRIKWNGISDTKDTKEMWRKILQYSIVGIFYCGKKIAEGGDGFKTMCAAKLKPLPARQQSIILEPEIQSTGSHFGYWAGKTIELCGNKICDYMWQSGVAIKIPKVVLWNLSMAQDSIKYGNGNIAHESEYVPPIIKGGCEVQSGCFRRADCPDAFIDMGNNNVPSMESFITSVVNDEFVNDIETIDDIKKDLENLTKNGTLSLTQQAAENIMKRLRSAAEKEDEDKENK
jgi:hypothetical protein